jgi:transcriptional regulator
MYIPPHHSTTNLTWLDWLAEHHAFGSLISQVDAAPFATPMPVLYRRTGTDVILTGHWARPNPQWRDIESQRALFIFNGPHDYISPRWYADKLHKVPTWNYLTAHVYGKVRALHDQAELERIVVALAKQYEAGAPAPWTLAESGSDALKMLRGIVGFELRADDVRIKVKLSQNQPVVNVQGAIDGLRATGSQEAAVLAELMQKELARR